MMDHSKGLYEIDFVVGEYPKNSGNLYSEIHFRPRASLLETLLDSDPQPEMYHTAIFRSKKPLASKVKLIFYSSFGETLAPIIPDVSTVEPIEHYQWNRLKKHLCFFGEKMVVGLLEKFKLRKESTPTLFQLSHRFKMVRAQQLANSAFVRVSSGLAYLGAVSALQLSEQMLRSSFDSMWHLQAAPLVAGGVLLAASLSYLTEPTMAMLGFRHSFRKWKEDHPKIASWMTVMDFLLLGLIIDFHSLNFAEFWLQIRVFARNIIKKGFNFYLKNPHKIPRVPNNPIAKLFQKKAIQSSKEAAARVNDLFDLAENNLKNNKRLWIARLTIKKQGEVDQEVLLDILAEVGKSIQEAITQLENQKKM